MLSLFSDRPLLYPLWQLFHALHLFLKLPQQFFNSLYGFIFENNILTDAKFRKMYAYSLKRAKSTCSYIINSKICQLLLIENSQLKMKQNCICSKNDIPINNCKNKLDQL